MVNLVKITPNFHKVAFGDTKVIYFSYEQPIAFYDGMTDTFYFTRIYEIPNGGSTTSRHLKGAHKEHINAKLVRESHHDLMQAIITHF
jgi:hypothetical protein